ncbi:MAG: hypothetical protein KatS3mg131_3911 [Candidatus Tectimicrobiota bacterium]|nr:MAG: hypothetical protein KatS3mg131_3911 [Candidatus Tectomicrobia bacterium]
MLFAGQVVQSGPPWQVFSRPATEAVARFVGAEINLPGTVEACDKGTVRLTTPVGPLEAAAALPVGTRVTLCLRPEDLTLYRDGQALPPSSARNQVRGTVVQLTPWGTQVRVTVDCGAPLVALITRPSLEALGLAPGVAVVVTFKASAVHLLRHHGGSA